MSYRDCYIWLIINEGDCVYKERWYVHDNLAYLPKMYPTAMAIQAAKTKKEADELVEYWKSRRELSNLEVITEK